MLTMWVTEDEHRRLLERCELNATEFRQRENEYQKTLELERQPQKTYRGPTL